MAELLLKIGDGANYEDGDILCAFNDRRIQLVHAEHICRVGKAGTQNGNRLRPNDSLTRMFLEKTRQYRFERISRAEVKRVTIATGQQATFGPMAAAGGEHMHVQEHVDRLLRHPRHAVFGEPGREIWYGGRTRHTHDALDAIWSEIEERTEYRRADHRRWPAGEQDLVSHLLITVDDFSDADAAELVAPLDAPGRKAKRRHWVSWQALQALEGQVPRIESRRARVDVRDVACFQRASVVRQKS
jgi:hypothetical protein